MVELLWFHSFVSPSINQSIEFDLCLFTVSITVVSVCICIRPDNLVLMPSKLIPHIWTEKLCLCVTFYFNIFNILIYIGVWQANCHSLISTAI